MVFKGLVKSFFFLNTYRLNFEVGFVPFLFWDETLDGRQQFRVGFVEMGVRQVHRSLCNTSRMKSKLVLIDERMHFNIHE